MKARMRTTPPPRFDVVALFPALRDRDGVAVGLHPRRGPAPPPSASKMGGLFLWPADEPWPVCTEAAWPRDGMPRTPHESAIVGVLQLRRADVPELPFPGEADLFQLLSCPHDHDATYSTICRAFWRRAADVTRRLDAA